MATLTLRTNLTAAISINGGFLGFIDENKPLTIPLPDTETFFTAIPRDFAFNQLNYFLSFEKGLCLMPCSGRLCRWSDNIYELFFVFEKHPSPPPPVILKEGQWGDCATGLCGGYFLKENTRGCKYFPAPVDDYDIIGDFAILKQKNRIIIIDKDFNEVLRRDRCSYIKDADKAILRFTPGEMDFFTVEQVFHKTIISSKIIQAECATLSDRLRCFCQAVRLDMDFSTFLTPQLKSEMSPDAIKDFLGLFDCTDTCRYLPSADNNTLALRYMVDPSNYHYLCYQFKTVNNLIDDISEL